MSMEPPPPKLSIEKLDQTPGLEYGPDGVVPEFFENTQEERDLVRKLDKRILPITCLLYLFACSFFAPG